MPGDTASFTLETPDLIGVDWNELHCIVLIDYSPGGWLGAFDMLQAAYAPFPDEDLANDLYLPLVER